MKNQRLMPTTIFKKIAAVAVFLSVLSSLATTAMCWPQAFSTKYTVGDVQEKQEWIISKSTINDCLLHAHHKHSHSELNCSINWEVTEQKVQSTDKLVPEITVRIIFIEKINIEQSTLLKTLLNNTDCITTESLYSQKTSLQYYD